MATLPKPVILDKNLRMGEGLMATPIIDNPKLKPMSTTAAAPRRIGGKVLLMSGDAAQPPADGPTMMQPMPTKIPPAAATRDVDQVAREPEPDKGPMSVRLRLRIVRGQAAVIGVHVVPGELATPERLDYGLAYEVMNGERRIALGSIPDVGTRRSFPDPEGRPGLQGHHIEELDSIEVNLRVPLREFSMAALPRLRVRLYRMKSQPPATPIKAEPLAEQFRDQLRPVAELRGIDLKLLPQNLQGDVRAAATAGTTGRKPLQR